MLLFLLLAACLYSLSAALPFFSLMGVPFFHYAMGLVISICTSLLWTYISRHTDKKDLSLVGLIYDLVLTTCFIVVPLIIQRKTLTFSQVVGIILVLIGLTFFKGGL